MNKYLVGMTSKQIIDRLHVLSGDIPLRNIEIFKSRLSGTTYPQLHKDFGLCVARLREIIHTISRGVRADPRWWDGVSGLGYVLRREYRTVTEVICALNRNEVENLYGVGPKQVQKLVDHLRNRGYEIENPLLNKERKTFFRYEEWLNKRGFMIIKTNGE